MGMGWDGKYVKDQSLVLIRKPAVISEIVHPQRDNNSTGPGRFHPGKFKGNEDWVIYSLDGLGQPSPWSLDTTLHPPREKWAYYAQYQISVSS
jgi:hypothetical protein